MSRTNICLQSEDFGTTWTEINARNNADTLNVAVAPDGATTADRLIDDSGTGASAVIYSQGITLSVDTAYTVSAFLKKEQLDWGRITIDDMGALATSAFFDLTNGAAGVTTGANNTSEFIEDFGNGWFRCGITFTSDVADTAVNMRIWLADGNGDSNVDRDGTSSILLWGAQLETGLFATRYIKTTAAAVTKVGADFIRRLDRPLARHISTVW